jgi:hypothetical protein
MPTPAICEDIDQHYVVGRYASDNMQQLVDLGVLKDKIVDVPRSDIELTSEEVEKRDLVTMNYIREISKACDACGCGVYLDSSGLLAASRNEKLARLSDVDLLLASGSILELETALKRIKKDWIIHSNIDPLLPDDRSQIVIMSAELMDPFEEPAVIDIRTPNLNPKMLSDPMLLRSHFKHSSKSLEDTSIKFPHRYEDYLEVLYGTNWRKPDQFYRP